MPRAAPTPPGARGAPGSDIIVVMGTSGVGKTTVARGIAATTGWEFAEGDDFHPPANIAKMRAGQPLTDDDRQPWLRRLRDWMAAAIGENRSVVVTCSALRRVYRDELRGAGDPVRFLHLVAPEALVRERMLHRQGHFMPPSLLESQYATLEELTPAELAAGSVVVSVVGSPPDVLRRCLEALGLSEPRDGDSAHDGRR